MAVELEKIGLTLTSRPGKCRPGLIPMGIALAVGFLFSGLWLTVSACLIIEGNFDHVIWGSLTGMCTLLYCFYMGYMAWKLLSDSRRDYLLELTGSEAVLTVVDHMNRKKSTQMVLLDDVKFAEYYPYPDSASVMLHAPYTVMEIPLWPLGNGGIDVIDFLAGRGIRVVNVQSDDRIPD